jgi:hypothetical protein
LPGDGSFWYDVTMGILPWIAQNWFESVQTGGVVGGLLLTAWTVRRDERAQQISNLIALNQRHNDIWSKLYEVPQLARVLDKDVDLRREPISDQELLFVKMLFLHLDTVRRTAQEGLFIRIHRLKNDVRAFMSLPIPKAVWENVKPFQDDDFVSFVEDSMTFR